MTVDNPGLMTLINDSEDQDYHEDPGPDTVPGRPEGRAAEDLPPVPANQHQPHGQAGDRPPNAGEQHRRIRGGQRKRKRGQAEHPGRAAQQQKGDQPVRRRHARGDGRRGNTALMAGLGSLPQLLLHHSHVPLDRGERALQRIRHAVDGLLLARRRIP